jgi:hypothetical protein
MIRIIKGVYGHIVNGIVEPKGINSAPFSLSDVREEELVACGIAAYVEEKPAKVSEDEEDGKDVNPNVNPNQEDDDPDDDKNDSIVEYNEHMKLPELLELATECGIDTTGMKKADVMKALDEYVSHLNESDGELPPAFDALNPVEQ